MVVGVVVVVVGVVVVVVLLSECFLVVSFLVGIPPLLVRGSGIPPLSARRHSATTCTRVRGHSATVVRSAAVGEVGVVGGLLARSAWSAAWSAAPHPKPFPFCIPFS